MRGLERLPIWPQSEQARNGSRDPDMDALLRNICIRNTDIDVVEHVIRNLAYAKSTIVSTPRCGAGKTLATLLPIIDTALKLRRMSSRDINCGRQFCSYSKPLFPTIMVIEPDARIGEQTATLLRSLVAQYDLGLVVDSFIDDNPTSVRPEYGRGESPFAGNIMVCTPSRAMRMLSTQSLSLDKLVLSFWNSVDKLFGPLYRTCPGSVSAQHFGDGCKLFSKIKRSSTTNRFVFAAHSCNSNVLTTISSNVQVYNRIESKIELNVPMNRRHHANMAHDVCVWENDTTRNQPQAIQGRGD